MEFVYDSHLAARILISLATVGYGFATIKADFNATHATNPLWTPHARFHVVWQILSYSGLAVIALGLIWIKGPVEVERLYLATGMGVAVFGAFFIALLARSMFGGTLYDQNGYQPFKAPFGPGHWQWDVNVTVFAVLTAILLLGAVLI